MASLSETRRLQKTKKKFLKQSKELVSRKEQSIQENVLKKDSEQGRFPGDGDSDSESSRTGNLQRRRSASSDNIWTPQARSSPVNTRYSHDPIPNRKSSGVSVQSSPPIIDDHSHSNFLVNETLKLNSSQLGHWRGHSVPVDHSSEFVVHPAESVVNAQTDVKMSKLKAQSVSSGLLVVERKNVGRSANEKAKLKELGERNRILESQLMLHTKVNAELKKLLVASVGDDLEYRFHKLIQDKADMEIRLKYHLENSLETSEEIEHLAIQSDVWRSKFVASSVMVDELAAWKAKLFVEMRDCQKALKTLMDERIEICDQVTICCQHLTRCVQQLEQKGLNREILDQLQKIRQWDSTLYNSDNPDQLSASASLVQVCKYTGNVSEVISHVLLSGIGTRESELTAPMSQCCHSAGEILARKALARVDASMSGATPNFHRQAQLMKREEATKLSRHFAVGESWNTYTAFSPIFPFSEMGKTTGDTINV